MNPTRTYRPRCRRCRAGEESVDPYWYKRAVFYEVLVRGFNDSNGDGTGDLRGLIEKLDYLQWLGVDCVWLLPIYASPLRDGGYDISDYTGIQPEFGDLSDFVALINEAHQRGIRVVADLVVNHTSDQHPWFQASRSDPTGPYGDFYVWADTDEGFADARIIFTDTEKSNWTFDSVRGQYYFHRFFYHQPDLNYDSLELQEAVLEVVRFWLDLGIDGFRLDAIPYLYAREGTNCENLPETHAFLKRLRREIDAKYADRVLLAEANQWPADVVALLRRLRVRRGRMPHGLPLPADAAHLHGGAPGDALSDLGNHGDHAGHPAELPMGHFSAQPRRADAGNGHRRRPRLHDEGVRQRPADEGQHRHPPSAGPAAGQQPRPDGAVHRAAPEPAGFPRALLRGRGRHGRQLLPRRPGRRAHAHALVPGPQRGLFHVRPAAAVPAGDHGPGLRLPVTERRGADAPDELAAVVDETPAGGAKRRTRSSGWAATTSWARPTRPCSPSPGSSATTASCAW